MTTTKIKPTRTASPVVVIKKETVRKPIEPRWRTSPKLAMPTIMELITKGTTSANKACKNKSPINAMLSPIDGANPPRRIPETIPRSMPMRR